MKESAWVGCRLDIQCVFAEAELLRLRERREGGQERRREGGNWRFYHPRLEGKEGWEEEASQVSEQGGKLSKGASYVPPRSPGNASAASAAGALGGDQVSQRTAGS